MGGYEFDRAHRPKFRIGQKVWVLQLRDYEEARVLAIEAILMKGEKESLWCSGYHTDRFNFNEGCRQFSCVFNLYEVVSSEEEAKKLTAGHPVTGITKWEWRRAKAEMGFCCADTARFLLTRCKKDGGLTERDLGPIRSWLEDHTPEKNKNLKKIFDQLNIEIKPPSS